jgi:membrane-associated protein
MLSAILASGFLNPEKLIESGGLLLVSLIIFAESGLFFGFFLPGDSLLFVSGFLSSSAGGNVLPPLLIVLLCVFAAAFIGDQVGFWFGRKVGPSIFNKPNSRFFKHDHVTKAHAFFERHGRKTIVLARFVPIVRTFAPIVAGVGGMDYGTFVTFNVIGAALWAVGLTTAGYFMGQIDIVRNHVEVAVVTIVALSLIPVVIEVVKHRREAKHSAVETTSAEPVTD